MPAPVAGRRRWLLIGAMTTGLLLSGCGTGAPGNGALSSSATLGQQVYTLDQLAPSPDDGSGVHLLYAIVRVSTTAASATVRERSFILVDSRGQSYAPVTPAVYVPIDRLDGLIVSPGHTGAGTLAFPFPAGRPTGLRIVDGAAAVELHAP